ncbi:MAG TPA: hypothetical protein PK854_02905 [Oscillospiraceae bacterium]|nr:hypothetical protein [Oscillospiraceae bacterium]HPS34194.1 hypothetical protein [Oscillospiraceae bacterium]
MARKLTSKEQSDPVFTPIRTKAEVGRWERFSDFWSEFRWLVILGIAVLLIIIYAVFSVFSKTPDLTLCIVTTGTAADAELGDRLVKELTPYAMDMNGDGKVLLVTEYCTIGSSGATEAAFELDIAGGKKFAVLSSPEATKYLAEHNLDEPMTSFSDKLPAGTVGVKVGQLDVFEKDLALYDDLEGWTFLMRSYSAEGLNKARETKTEQASAFHFYVWLLNNWNGELPGAVSQ